MYAVYEKVVIILEPSKQTNHFSLFLSLWDIDIEGYKMSSYFVISQTSDAPLPDKVVIIRVFYPEGVTSGLWFVVFSVRTNPHHTSTWWYKKIKKQGTNKWKASLINIKYHQFTSGTPMKDKNLSNFCFIIFCCEPILQKPLTSKSTSNVHQSKKF